MIIKDFNPSFTSRGYSSDNDRTRKNFGRALVLKNDYTEEEKAEINTRRRNRFIQKLSELSEEERIEEAGRLYTALQARILKAISSRQKEIGYFNEYKDKISYYTGLLKNSDGGDNVCVADKKYEIAEKFNTTNEISKETIKEYLDRATESLKNIVDSPLPREDERNIGAATSYSGASKWFAAVIGMFAECLEIEGDDSFFHWQDGLTYDNFIEKKEEAVEKLEARSEGLFQLMKKYREENGIDDEDFGLVGSYKMNAIDEVRRQFLMTGKISMTEHTVFLLDTLA